MECINRHIQLESPIVKENDEIKGFLTSVEEALDLVKSFECYTNTRFVCWKRPAIFGKKEMINSRNHRVQFMGGLPHFVISSMTLACHQGSDSKKYRKLKRMELNKELGYEKRRLFSQNSKKLDCPAVVTIKEIFAFTKHKIDNPTAYNKRSVATTIRAEVEALVDERLKGDWLYYITLPSGGQHKNHVVSSATMDFKDLTTSVRPTDFRAEAIMTTASNNMGRSDGESATKTVNSQLSIYVCSLSTRHPELSEAQSREAYVEAMRGWVQLVAADYGSLWTRARDTLQRTYDCRLSDVSDKGLVAVVDVTCAARSLIGLECDQQSGQLTNSLQQYLVTDAVKATLNVDDLSLITELSRQR